VTAPMFEERLAACGEALEFPGADTLADDVLAIIRRDDRASTPWRRAALVAAALLAVIALVVALIPDSRHAVARWFGLERLEVRVVDEIPATSGGGPGPAFTLDGAAMATGVVPYVVSSMGDPVGVHVPDGRYVAVSYDDAGTKVVVATLPGRLFYKAVGERTQVRPVDVGGVDGIWVTGAPHVLVYESLDGDVVEARAATDALAWQEGDVIVRIEGDIPLTRALELAADVRPAARSDG
jgi:hypothetical protein